jgi:predicted glycosyltransferase
VRIWIDLSNSPHPLLFAPIARRLEELGHEVGITARDNAQTVDLTLERWPDATIIGGPSPKARSKKAQAMVKRIRKLRRWARSFRADVALSHNSYGQIAAARMLGLRVVTAMDYEGQQANHLAFRLAHLILMPAALRRSALRRQGAVDRQVCFYPGFKEEIYLGDFEPDLRAVASIGIEQDGRPLVVARTPPSRAAYHQFGNPLFDAALQALGRDANARVVILVRHAEQRKAIEALKFTNLIVPERAIDSRSLMYEADLMIGAGGTMTRESALLRLPTFSAFAGEQPAVDRELERRGYLRRLRNASELVPAKPRAADPRPVEELRVQADALVKIFVAAAISTTSLASESVRMMAVGSSNDGLSPRED